MNQQNITEIDLIELFFHLKKKLWIICVACLIGGILGFCFGKFLTVPQYTATTRMYVLNRTGSASSVVYADIQTSTYLSNDYRVLITGDNVTDAVISSLGLEMDHQALARMIEVTIPDNTRVLQISVTHNDPQLSAQIANAVREVASTEIKRIMAVDAVNLVYAAKVPTNPSSHGALFYTVLAMFFSFVGVVGIISVLFVLDDTIRNEDDLERYLGLSTFGVIPASPELQNNPAVRGAKGRK